MSDMTADESSSSLLAFGSLPLCILRSFGIGFQNYQNGEQETHLSMFQHND
jgi:hypothetical protein